MYLCACKLRFDVEEVTISLSKIGALHLTLIPVYYCTCQAFTHIFANTPIYIVMAQMYMQAKSFQTQDAVANLPSQHPLSFHENLYTE